MTSLENLPSDNLYKFIFFVGITLVIASIILVITQYDKIINKADQFHEETIFLQNDINFVQEKIKKLDSTLTKVEQASGADKISNRNLSSMESIRNKLDELCDLKHKITIKGELLVLRFSQIKRENYRLFIYMAIAVIMLGSGLFLSCNGFNNWYSKIQKPLDDKLNLEIQIMSNQKKTEK